MVTSSVHSIARTAMLSAQANQKDETRIGDQISAVPNTDYAMQMQVTVENPTTTSTEQTKILYHELNTINNMQNISSLVSVIYRILTEISVLSEKVGRLNMQKR